MSLHFEKSSLAVKTALGLTYFGALSYLARTRISDCYLQMLAFLEIALLQNIARQRGLVNKPFYAYTYLCYSALLAAVSWYSRRDWKVTALETAALVLTLWGVDCVIPRCLASRPSSRFTLGQPKENAGPFLPQDEAACLSQLQFNQLIPSLCLRGQKAAQQLGLLRDGKLFWQAKLEVTDIKDENFNLCINLIGVKFPNLMTGPVFNKEILEQDRASYQLHRHSRIEHIQNIDRLITHTLACTIEGDGSVIRPHQILNSCALFGGFRNNLEHAQYDDQLLSDIERRQKRWLLASSYATASAWGGFNSARQPLPRKFRFLYIKTIGCQFERHRKSYDELEASDFLIKKGSPEKIPLFPDLYKDGKIPAFDAIDPDACDNLGDFKKEYANLPSGDIFNRQAFEASHRSYMLELVFPAIEQRLGKQPFYLKAVLFGGGFFAETPQKDNLRIEIIQAMLTTYIEALDKGWIPESSAVELPHYGGAPQTTLNDLLNKASEKKVDIIWAPQGDSTDFNPQTSVKKKKINPETFEKQGTLVVLASSDGMAWEGNEFASQSVDAALANNSNTRLVMNWWANPQVFKEIEKLEASIVPSSKAPPKSISNRAHPFPLIFQENGANEENKALNDLRNPLKKKLAKYFKLDQLGYILDIKSDQTLQTVQSSLCQPQEQEEIAQLFYALSTQGDAAYAEDIRTTLARFEITSSPVDKNTGIYTDQSLRPYSYVPSKGKNLSFKEAPLYATKAKGSQPAYLGRWDYVIWKGHKTYRARLQKPKVDMALTPAQSLDYTRRLNRVETLHKEGWLVGRVADLQEVHDFIGHRYRMENDILSTTLLPHQNAPLVMELFSEAQDTVGIFLDPTRVGTYDFGVSFSQNAYTVGSGFLNHKVTRLTSNANGIRGAVSLSAQRDLLRALSNTLEEGGSVHNLDIQLDKEGKNYTVKKQDVRQGAQQAKSRRVPWNEQTYYRGIEKDFFLALFVKSDSSSFSQELSCLFKLQHRMRILKGIFIPIFQFKGATNVLEEIIPDRLLLTLTGAGPKAAPVTGRRNYLSTQIEKAGITEKIAIEMAEQLFTTKELTMRHLIELQLATFNMKDLRGEMKFSTQVGNIYHYESVRILDNLHLVFPTTQKTNSALARKPNLYFKSSDYQALKNSAPLYTYMQAAVKYNLQKFLGIKLNPDGPTFDPSYASVFDTQDPKKTDFAKVLSRALQCAVLFSIEGEKTTDYVIKIAEMIRKMWPYFGMTPSGCDMVLGSLEMQQVLKDLNLKENALTHSLEWKPTSNSNTPLASSFSQEIDPFNVEIKASSLGNVREALSKFGMKEDGTVDDKTLQNILSTDPHLQEYEKKIIPEIHILCALSHQKLGETFKTHLRKLYPPLGYTAEGKDLFSDTSPGKMQWILEEIQKKPHAAEFPFPRVHPLSDSTKDSGRAPLGVRGASSRSTPPNLVFLTQSTQGTRTPPAKSGTLSPFPMRHDTAASTPLANPAPSTTPLVPPQRLKALVQSKKLLTEHTDLQKQAMRDLGLLNAQGTPLWEVDPKFYDDDPLKPQAPYMQYRDLLGDCLPQLLTGPALNPEVLEKDQASYLLSIQPQYTQGIDISRLVTHTLAMTTEGDEQVLRPNGLQYSRALTAPPGGHIDFNGGNEKHLFRSNKKRSFHRPYSKSEDGYQGMGAYFNEDLKKVEEYDQKLLSDRERRIKRAALLPSAYVTITARGGYGCERTPLLKSYRVLYCATAGCQFEKYGQGPFHYQDKTKDDNELEAADFIIKKSAAAVPKPLFPDFYPNKIIPAHSTILKGAYDVLDDRCFKNPFVQLKDGAFFYRQAFQTATTDYLQNLVLPAILKRINSKPFYLKASLFGGGFFANAGAAGNLRAEVVQATLNAYTATILVGSFPKSSVIEFPRYGAKDLIPQELKTAAQKCQVTLVWTEEGDICDFGPQTSDDGTTLVDPASFETQGTLVVLGAIDAMSWLGNEPVSSSLDSMLGNNSNARLVMNWWANPRVLEFISKEFPKSHKKI